MMFLDNEYTRRYFKIIEKARVTSPTGYSEKHHIVPRCFGGTNQKTNLIKLTGRDHFVCHQLLVEMFSVGSVERGKMAFALKMMANSLHKAGYEVTPKEYEQVRILNSIATSDREKQRVKDGIHPFQNEEFHSKRSERSIQQNNKRVQNGTHHWVGGEFQREQQKKLIEEGKHLFLNKEFQKKRNELVGRVQQELVYEGKHNFQNSELQKKRSQKRWAKSNSRQNVSDHWKRYWASWRYNHGKPAKPGDEEFFKEIS